MKILSWTNKFKIPTPVRFTHVSNINNIFKLPTQKKNTDGYVLNGFLFMLVTNCSLSVEFDAPEKWQRNFQDPATPVMEKIIDLHHDIQFF